MAHNYKKFDFENGDIPVPEMWNVNMNNYSSELNGMLDRDNLPRNAIGLDQTNYSSSNSTHTFVSFTQYLTAFAVQTDFKGWQTVPMSISPMNGVGDEMLAIEASIQVDVDWGASPPGADTIQNMVRFQMLVDGIVVCESGPMSLVYQKFCVPLDGVVAITAGSKAPELQVRYQMGGGVTATHPDGVEVDDLEIVFTRWKR
jgi:hypothetical protein